MDLSDLPRSAQDRIAAAEIEADSILTDSHRAANLLASQAYRMGVDPSGIGFSPGDIPLDLARQELDGGRDRAAGHLFGATAGEYLKTGKLDNEAFNATLEEIGGWIARKYHTNRNVLDQFKQHCRVEALRRRAADREADEGAEAKKGWKRAAGGDFPEANKPGASEQSSRTEPGPTSGETNGNGTYQRVAIDAFISTLAEAGRKVSRKDFWTVAGYKDPTEFERFQRGDTRTTKSAATAFNRVLSMKPDDFIRLLDSRSPAT